MCLTLKSLALAACMWAAMAAPAALPPLASAAYAAGGGSSAEPADIDAARQVEVPNLVVPVVRNGQLRNYIYVTIRMHTQSGADVQAMREKGHFLRDALLRASHKIDLADPARDDQLNLPLAKETFARVAREVLGAQLVGEVELLFITSLRRSGR
jgi:hypothetical protein